MFLGVNLNWPAAFARVRPTAAGLFQICTAATAHDVSPARLISWVTPRGQMVLAGCAHIAPTSYFSLQLL